MMLMIILALFILGLCLGSFVNALIWRIHECEKENTKKATDKKYIDKLSIARGRSMCPHCKHVLKTKDLIPVISWVILRGKCRYCKKPISIQYPLIELTLALLFVLSYLFWPSELVSGNSQSLLPHLFHGATSHSNILFVLWLVLLVGLLALFVYDLRWFLLPNRIIYPLGAIAGLMALVAIFSAPKPLIALVNTILAVVVGGGLFHVLFQVSNGKWIGGGDVKLGWVLGLVAGTPAHSVLFIFIASVIGTIISVPLLATNRLKRTSTIPFGPLLIIGAIITQLFGANILHWYQHIFINI